MGYHVNIPWMDMATSMVKMGHQYPSQVRSKLPQPGMLQLSIATPGSKATYLLYVYT